MKHLTAFEGTKLAALIHRVNESIKSAETHWREANKRAQELRDSGYWKSKSNTWGGFCQLQGWSAHRLNQIANSEAFLREIEERIGTTVPISITERATRELKKDTPEKAAKVLETLSKNGALPSLSNVAQARKQVAEDYEPTDPTDQPKPKEPEIVRDKTGVPIPPKPLEYWNRRQEVQDMLTTLSKLKSQVEASREAKDMLWVRVSQHLITQLELCYSHAKDAMPYSVCTLCNGWPKETKCTFCDGMGILPKHRYQGTDDRIRAIREKQHAKFIAA